MEHPPAAVVLSVPTPPSAPCADKVMKAPLALFGDSSAFNFSMAVSPQPHVPLLGI